MKKNVHTWIWIRSSIPKRAWRKCIEYTVTDKNGKKEIYSVDEETGTQRKVQNIQMHTLNMQTLKTICLHFS